MDDAGIHINTESNPSHTHKEDNCLVLFTSRPEPFVVSTLTDIEGGPV